MQSQQQLRHRLLTFDSILHKLFDYPSIVLIGGIWKSGKTDFALYLAERLLRLPLFDMTVISEVASNIDTEGKFNYIYDLRSLRQWLYSSKKRKLYILDEASEHLPSRRAMTSKNIGFIQIIPEISKAHARMLIVGHQLLTIDKTLLDATWCRGAFIKLGLKKAELISTLIPRPYTINDIPPTTIPFDPYSIAPFQENAPGNVMFKDDDRQTIWEWINGKNYKELNIKPMTLHRLIKKILKCYMENDLNA